MKQLLIILSSLTTLTLASNVVVNVVNSNTTININLTSNPSNDQTSTSLFNNKFGCLNQDSWITNQSTTDGKYYSYDTSHAVGTLSEGTPTKNAFIVDSNGNLTIDASLKLSDSDKSMLSNIQQEMVRYKQVTSVKDSYNPYSKSVYSDSFFNGDNSSWKYLQMGGFENHIDISSQQSANKVAHSNSLSETLGLYYIAKAERSPGGIDSTVANSLGKYFISQSSLKNLDDSLTSSIINVIANNANVYDLILDAPPIDGQTELYKNYSINYIFDNSNNLIEVYYNKFDGDNKTQNIGYWWSDNYSRSSDSSNNYNFFNWKKYASTWSEFTILYPWFVFNDSVITLNIYDNNHKGELENFSDSTDKILETKGSDNTNSVFDIEVSYDEHGDSGNARFDLNIWHDSENIWFCWFFKKYAAAASYLAVQLNSVSFINLMN